SFTENLVIDALLTQLEERCLIENIHLDLVVKPLNIKEIKDIDLAILFGNAFDNALEAVSPLPEDQKKICLSMHFKKNYLFITLKNNQNNHYHFHSDYSYPTTKENKKNHGFGLKNMEQVVSKYDGQLKIKNEKETFTLVLVLKDAL
ncbi:MAG: ATP-binding protein, partial [Carnobacterium sp.]